MIKKLLYISLLILPLVCIAQSSRQKGQVFKTRPDYPMENLDKSGEIVVTRTMYRLVFEDDAIPDAYKKMVERFFSQVFYNEYKKIGVQYKKAAVLHDIILPRITKDKDSYIINLADKDGDTYAVVKFDY